MWFYVKDGQATGPIEDNRLRAMVARNEISATTLVWRDGMADWIPYHEAAAQGMFSPPPIQPAPPLPPFNPPQAAPGPQPQGGPGQYPPADVNPYGGPASHVPAQPWAGAYHYDQPAYEYGGFWVRSGALFLDGVILYIVFIVLALLFFPDIRKMFDLQHPDPNAIPKGLNFVLTAIQMAYYTFFVGKFGATPGKMAFKLKIVRADGGAVSYLQAFARFWAQNLISGCLTLSIGYLIAAFDDQKRTLHDRICGTRVIKTN